VTDEFDLGDPLLAMVRVTVVLCPPRSGSCHGGDRHSSVRSNSGFPKGSGTFSSQRDHDAERSTPGGDFLVFYINAIDARLLCCVDSEQELSIEASAQIRQPAPDRWFLRLPRWRRRPAFVRGSTQRRWRLRPLWLRWRLVWPPQAFTSRTKDASLDRGGDSCETTRLGAGALSPEGDK
jgi:hypothetical protein